MDKQASNKHANLTIPSTNSRADQSNVANFVRTGSNKAAPVSPNQWVYSTPKDPPAWGETRPGDGISSGERQCLSGVKGAKRLNLRGGEAHTEPYGKPSPVAALQVRWDDQSQYHH